jgi:lysophospholipase L1-like esterase
MFASTPRLAVVACPLAALAALLSASPAFAAPLKVACTGTSAMQGLGSSMGHHVPDELGKALGSGFVVSNFGAQGTTAIASISASYAASSQMKAALAFNPDVVLFWFGGNDSFQGTWAAHKTEFKADYTSLVRTFQALPTHPKTFLVRLWTFVDGPVQKSVLDKEILPLIDQIAEDTGSTLIDYRKQFENHPEFFPDGMHPNDTGTAAIGKFFGESVTTALAAVAGTGGATSLGGAGGGATDTAGGAAGAGSATGGATGSGGAPAESGAANAPTAGTTGIGGAAGSGGNASSGSASLPIAGTPNVQAPLAAVSDDSGDCRMSRPRNASASSALWLLLAGLGLVRRRTATQSAAAAKKLKQSANRTSSSL